MPPRNVWDNHPRLPRFGWRRPYRTVRGFSKMKRRAILLLVFAITGIPACKDTAKISMTEASAHVAFLAGAVGRDVEEVRHGLPQGADLLAASWKADPSGATDLKAAADSLEAVRRKVQDLRLAKSTFFAIADDNGIVLRNDQEQDRM